MAQYKAEVDLQDRFAFPMQTFAAGLMEQQDFMCQPSVEECIISLIALAGFARFSALEMLEGVEDAKALYEDWAQYDEEEYAYEDDHSYEGYESLG